MVLYVHTRLVKQGEEERLHLSGNGAARETELQASLRASQDALKASEDARAKLQADFEAKEKAWTAELKRLEDE